MNEIEVETERTSGEVWLLTPCGGGHVRPPKECTDSSDIGDGKTPEHPTNIALSRKNGQLIQG